MRKTLLTLILLCYTTLAHADNYVIQTIAYEASSEGLRGQIMVASVIKQRMIDRQLTAEQVVLQPYQFSCWKNGKPTQKRKLTVAELEKAKLAWQLAKPEGYNHYCKLKCNPYWSIGQKYIVIGKHKFYKL